MLLATAIELCVIILVSIFCPDLIMSPKTSGYGGEIVNEDGNTSPTETVNEEGTNPPADETVAEQNDQPNDGQQEDLLNQILQAEQIFQNLSASSNEDLEGLIARIDALKLTCDEKKKPLKETLATRKSAIAKAKSAQKQKDKQAEKSQKTWNEKMKYVNIRVRFMNTLTFSVRVRAGDTIGEVRRLIIERLNFLFQLNRVKTKKFAKDSALKMELTANQKSLHENTRPELKSFEFDYDTTTFFASLPNNLVQGIDLTQITNIDELEDDSEDDEDEEMDEDADTAGQ